MLEDKWELRIPAKVGREIISQYAKNAILETTERYGETDHWKQKKLRVSTILRICHPCLQLFLLLTSKKRTV